MIEILEKKNCCGCSACAQICPKQCISMAADEEGFLYPSIDADRCINCGLCEKVCPEQRKEVIPADIVFSVPKAYGGWYKNDQIRLKSSSGGAFSLFANYILASGGSVYGCVLDEQLSAIHTRTTEQSGLAAMRGSKYVQSDINGTYQAVWNDLTEEKQVLFTGTPCQAAGLHSYIETKLHMREYEAESFWKRLYICDFICHGVPSPEVFQSYVQEMEKKYHDKIISFQFRTKDKPWNPSGLQLGTAIYTAAGKYIRNYPAFKDPFMNGFLSDLYLRPSCHDCQFKFIPKGYADFTIADFWGVQKVNLALVDGKGTSLLLVHNIHGQELFKAVQNQFHYEEVNFEKAIARNQSLISSPKKNPEREEFFLNYRTKTFADLEKKYMKASHWFFYRGRGMIWKIFEKNIRRATAFFLNIFHVQWTPEKWESFLQFVKFCLVGLSNAAVSYAINIITLLFLRPFHFRHDYIAANTMAFLLSVLWSFHWNSKYVFTEREGEHRSKIKTLWKMYVAYAFSGIVVNNLMGTFWIAVMQVSKFVAPLLNIPITMLINFSINKFWTFKKDRSQN